MMFGLIQKMEKFSNKVMTEEEEISFLQEIVDNGMVWEMHEKYQNAALYYMGLEQHKKAFSTLKNQSPKFANGGNC
jgi:hypothetical protein